MFARLLECFARMFRQRRLDRVDQRIHRVDEVAIVISAVDLTSDDLGIFVQFFRLKLF
jgi:hypothetical protein